MSPFAALRRSSLTLLVAGATGLMVASTATAVPAPASDAPQVLTGQHGVAQDASVRKARKTRVVVKVRKCAKCELTLVSAPRPPSGVAEPDIWTSRPTRVKKGKVVFRVPAAHTQGLYVTVWDRNSVSTGAMAIAVARYRGQRIGKTVSAKKAARAKRGFHCVAKPTKKKVVWKLRVDRFPGRDAYTGDSGYHIRPYLTPTKRQFGHTMRLHRGVASTQDIAFCRHTP